MPDQPTPDQSFSIHLKSLTDFADEFTTQIESLQAPMDHLATMSDTEPQYGAFAEAWSLGAGEQAAIEEMYSLLGQVKQAIAFAGTITGTVADGYKRADENIASALGGPPAGGPPVGSQSYEHGGPLHTSGYDNTWQNAQVTGNQITFPDPGSTTPDPGSFVPGAVNTANSVPTTPVAGPATPVTNLTTPVTNLTSPVGHMVTGAQPAGGPLPVWTPPPAAAVVPPAVPAPPPQFPDPSWTDYFQGGV